MTSLTCKLTPPRKGSDLSSLSPDTFLNSKEAMAPLKRKARFTHLNAGYRKKLRLDPAPVLGDSTITIYHERTQALMPDDRDKIHVCMPFEEELDEFKLLKDRVGRLEAERDVHRAELDANRLELDANRIEMNANRVELDANRKSRLIMLVTNALIDLARMIASKCNVELTDDHSTTRLQQFAATVKNYQLQKMQIPSKYWDSLRKLDQHVTTRNQQAHETKGDFAQLLLSYKNKDQPIYERWKDIFPLLYGEPVEAIAAKQVEEENQMLLGHP